MASAEEAAEEASMNAQLKEERYRELLERRCLRLNLLNGNSHLLYNSRSKSDLGT